MTVNDTLNSIIEKYKYAFMEPETIEKLRYELTEFVTYLKQSRAVIVSNSLREIYISEGAFVPEIIPLLPLAFDDIALINSYDLISVSPDKQYHNKGKVQYLSRFEIGPVASELFVGARCMVSLNSDDPE